VDLIREEAAELVQKAAAVVLALEATAKVVLVQNATAVVFVLGERELRKRGGGWNEARVG
jgi:hypothetical protein